MPDNVQPQQVLQQPPQPVQPPQQQQPAPPQQPAATEQPEPQQQAGGEEVTVEQILSFEPMLGAAFEAGKTPADVTAELIGAWGTEALGSLLQVITLERLIETVHQHGPDTSPLRTRGGEKFVTELWAELTRAVRQP
jgi:hypothetical protein